MDENVFYQDGILRISLMGGQARAFLAETTHLVERARQIHALSRTATAALGRTLTATAMMGVMLKGEKESITCQIKGGGPIGTVLAVGKPDGSVKGYVDNPDIELPRAGKKLPVGAAVGHEGMLTVIKDLGMAQPYVGQVHLVSGEIAEDFARYFTASEQTPSLVSLGVLVGENVAAAGGLIIQVMPDATEAAIQSLETSAGMFMDISGTMKTDHLEGAVQQLLGHLEPEIIGRVVPRYRCDCNREKIERMLISLGEDELTDMMAVQHGAEVDCQFCRKRQRFTEDELGKLLNEAKNRRQ